MSYWSMSRDNCFKSTLGQTSKKFWTKPELTWFGSASLRNAGAKKTYSKFWSAKIRTQKFIMIQLCALWRENNELHLFEFILQDTEKNFLSKLQNRIFPPHSTRSIYGKFCFLKKIFLHGQSNSLRLWCKFFFVCKFHPISLKKKQKGFLIGTFFRFLTFLSGPIWQSILLGWDRWWDKLQKTCRKNLHLLPDCQVILK